MRVLRRAVGLVLLLGLVCGCSQQAAATDDLIHALTDAHSAIASSILGIDLYDQDRSTRAATETLLDDMARQIADAERSLEPIGVDSETQSERDAALAAIHTGGTALLRSRDQLDQRGTVDNTADLESAIQQVDDLLSQLRASQ